MRDTIMAATAGLAGVLAAVCVVLFVRIDGLENRVAALETKADGAASTLVYHDVQLAAHSEALVDWYSWRRARSQGWGTGYHWAAIAMRDEEGDR